LFTLLPRLSKRSVDPAIGAQPVLCNVYPVKCLPREMRSLFFWGKAYFIGVAMADGIASHWGEKTSKNVINH